MTALVPVKGALDRAVDYAQSSHSEATKRAYQSDWRDFMAWCEWQTKIDSLPELVAAYLAQLADEGKSASTITRRVAAIAYAHRLKGVASPTSTEPVKAVLRGIRRQIGVAQVRKAPTTARVLTAMLRKIPDSLIGKRDRATLLLGFAAALRRSELVALEVADLVRTPEGMLVHLGRSKTDQDGEGYEVAVPHGSRLKPIEAVEQWLAAAGITEGPVFRPIAKGDRVKPEALNDNSVALIVKRYALAAKLDPADFSGHSLRAGFITSALEQASDLFRIMDVTRHRSVDTLRVYDRRAKAFKDHAGRKFL